MEYPLTSKQFEVERGTSVLIPVVMEYPLTDAVYRGTGKVFVLIPVVMEYPLTSFRKKLSVAS